MKKIRTGTYYILEITRVFDQPRYFNNVGDPVYSKVETKEYADYWRALNGRDRILHNPGETSNVSFKIFKVNCEECKHEFWQMSLGLDGK